MMASLMSYFGGRKDPKQTARDSIVDLRQHVQMMDKKEEYLQKKIEEDLKKAKANVVSNKAVATAALKRKKMNETELDRLAGYKMQLETQIHTLESANLNMQTMTAMKKASDVLKSIHGPLTIQKVDDTMAAINEQRELANEIADSIAQPVGTPFDDDIIKDELEQLEQDTLNERLAEADHVPVHIPSGAQKAISAPQAVLEDDEEEQLRQLQASLAM
ncbi:hypothetical protein APHAL10511_001814 [Amanita phalloides]|nr:hypothetical protein APHAL10511_001814 [Amanita phalloides]